VAGINNRYIMRRFFLLAFSIIVSGFFLIVDAQVPFSRGVNITSWFQTSGAREIQFSKYSKKDFENIKKLGCDVIRLPINLFYMTDGEADYTVDTLLFKFLDQVVTWAEELNMYLILDNHTTDDMASKNHDLEAVLSGVWKQIAGHFKDRSSYIIYEIMNEPNGITTAAWGKIQQTAIHSIREADSVHTIIVGASAWNTYNELKLLPLYTDNKLIYTFHFYDPFIFTHQGATWPVPSLGPLSGIPFPYNADSMPPLPDALKGTWIENSYKNYNNEGTVAHVKELIDIAVDFQKTRNAALYCGEFGAYIPNCRDTDRIYWYSEVRKYLEENGIAWTTWDYKGGFGLFEKGSDEMFDYDLNIPLVGALGLIEPPQYEYEIRPDSSGFAVYSDYIGENIVESDYANGGTIDFYSVSRPNNDDYCLSWNGSSQYGYVGFNFIPDKDLSLLFSEGFAVSLIVRGNAPGTTIDLRFLDTKTSDPADHPWRMNYTLSESDAAWDSRWHSVYLPLSDFIDQGSWDNDTWYGPIGAFDWKAVDRFEIVAEQGPLTEKIFWFDNIIIADQDTAQVFDTSTFIPTDNISDWNSVSMDLLRLYPNPFMNTVTIEYQLSHAVMVLLTLSDITGRVITTLVNGMQSAGTYFVHWNAERCPKGIYFCRLTLDDNIHTRKMILIR
jgi:endoglucanase